MELRLRRKPIREIVRDFDAFPKVNETLVEQKKASGGIILVICLALICWLVWGEIDYYNELHYEYKFLVDTDFNRKLQLDIDITVASSCDAVGADVMDATGQSLPYVFGELKTEPTKFELTALQKQYFNFVLEMKKKRFGQTPRLDSLLYIKHNLLQQLAKSAGDQALEDAQESDLNACRIHGTLKINKVAGNLHITTGKSLPLVGGGHAHLNFFGLSANFSHRISRFSFDSDAVPGIVNPLDALEKVDTTGRHLFQYYLEIVPTLFQSDQAGDGQFIRSCQYSMTQRNRVIDHERGSHGMPGVYFKYDLSPVMVRIERQSESRVDLLLRICCIVGGVFATSGFVNNIVSWAVNFRGKKPKCAKREGGTNNINDGQKQPNSANDRNVSLTL